MADISLTITERPVEMAVELDFSRLSMRDLLAFQQAQRDSVGNEDEQQRVISAMVAKVTGQDALDLPAVVYLRVAEEVIKRLSGDSSAKN